MLKHKYRHTKESHIELLRDWVRDRDIAFVQNILNQATYLSVDARAIAEGLDCPVQEIEAWLTLGLSADRRKEIDEGVQTLFASLSAKRISGDGEEKEGGERARTVRDNHPVTWVVVKRAFPSLAAEILPMVVGSLGDFGVYGYEVSAEDASFAQQVIEAEEADTAME